MAKHSFIELTTRGLLNISGDDARDFLQGLVTCNIASLTTGEIAFGALLSPQGKILFDFFIIASTNGFILDVDKSMIDELTKRLMFYRLRAKVNIEPMDERAHIYAVTGANPSAKNVVADGVICADPRLAEMGLRAYIRRAPEGANSGTLDEWHRLRLRLGIPEGGIDFSFGDAFPHEALMDQFKGVDFSKGCYVGQEVVSRMQHRGTSRKRLIKVTSSISLPKAGSEILSDGKVCGSLTSVQGTIGMGMVRLDRVAGDVANHVVQVGAVTADLSIQDWCNFNWPSL